MMTTREYARNATATLHHILHIQPDEIDDDGTTAVIERAIKDATRERDGRVRQQLKNTQAAAELRLAQLLNSSPAVVYSFKATGELAPTFVSENIRAIFGYSPDEYLEHPSFWRDRVHPDDLARVDEAVSKFFQNGIHAMEYRFRRKDGSWRWVNDEQRLIKYKNGRPLEVVGSWSDISARKAAEEAQTAAHARLSKLLISSPAVIYSYRAMGDLAPTFVSENIRDCLGYEPQEYLENADFWHSRVHPDELAAVEAESVHLFKKGRHAVEYRFLKKDGSWCSAIRPMAICSIPDAASRRWARHSRRWFATRRNRASSKTRRGGSRSGWPSGWPSIDSRAGRMCSSCPMAPGFRSTNARPPRAELSQSTRTLRR